MSSLYEPGQVWFIPITGTTVVLLEDISYDGVGERPHWFSFRAYVIGREGWAGEHKTVKMGSHPPSQGYVRTA